MYLMTFTRPDLAYPLSILARYVTPGRHRPENYEAAKRVLRYLCSTLGMGLVLGGRGPVVLTGHEDASWSTCSSSVLSSICEAEIYARAMVAQETKHIALRYFLSRELHQCGQLRLAYVATRANTADIFTKALQPGDHQRFCTVLGLPEPSRAARAEPRRSNRAALPWPSRATLLCPTGSNSCSCSYCTTATAPTATAATMATPSVLTFDAEGRPIKFEWQTRDAHACLAVRSHLPLDEREHFGQHKTAKELYDAVVARYSSPATAAIGRLSLPYLFSDLSAFATVADLITHLRTMGDARAAGAKGAGVVEVEEGAAAVEGVGGAGVVAEVGVARVVGGSGAAQGVVAVAVVGVVGAVETVVAAVKREADVVERCSQRQQQQTPSPQQLREWYSQRGGSGGGGTFPYVIRTGDGTGQTCGRFHTAQRCFFRLDDAWREKFPNATELPRWADLGTSASAALGPGEAAALGTRASTVLGPAEAAALGTSESPPPGASASALAGTASSEALLTFTLDSGASHCFFRDRTALEQLARPVAVSLADPSGGPVIATSSTVLSCPAVPSGTLSGLYLPSFSTNLVAGSALQDGSVHQFTPAYERVTHCTCARTCRHLATFTRQPGSDLYTLTTESPLVAAFVSASGQLSAPCSCRSLSHQTVLWHHRLGHPSVQRLHGMHSRYLVSGLPRVLPPLPPSPAPPCLPCIKGRQRAAPHSSSFPPIEAPLQTLHLDVWGPARVRGQGHERYFLLVVDDYTSYSTVFPLRTKGEVPDVLIPWMRAARLQLRERFQSDFPVLRLHSDRGGEFSSDQSGVAERCIGLVMEIARTSLIHAAAPHFLWPFALQYAAHQLNLWPCISAPETSPTLLWTGQVGDASRFQVWGCRDTNADKLFARAVPCVFLGLVPDAPGWLFYHPTSRRVFPSQDVSFDELVPFYRLFPYRTTPLPPPPLFLTPGAPPVDPLPPQGPAPSGVSQRGTEPEGTEPEGTETGGAETEGAETGGAAPLSTKTGGTVAGGAEPGGAEPRGTEPGGLDPVGAPSSQQLREWYARRCSLRGGAPSFELPPAGGLAAPGGAAGATGGSRAVGGAAGAAGGATRAAGGAAGASGRTAATIGAAGAAGGTGAAGAAGGTGAAGAPSGAPGPGTGGAAGAGPNGGATGAAGVGAAVGGSGAGSAGSGGTSRPRPYFFPLLQQVLGQSPPPCPAPSLECPSPVRLQSLLQPTSPLPGPSPYTGPTGGLTERREPESRSASPVCPARPGRRVPRQRPPAVPGTHQMLLCLSTTPRRVPLPSPPASSLPALADPESDSLRAASPAVTRLLSTVVTDSSFESAAASALVTELVDFAAHRRLDYAASLAAASESVRPPSVGGECTLNTDVLEDKQEEFECFAAAVPHLVSMLIAPEGDPDALESDHSSKWQTAMDAEMASWKSTGTYVDEVPPPGANIVSGMWIFRVKRPPGSPPVFKARYVARGFSQRQRVDFFQTFSPTPKMTTLRGSLHEEIWLRRPPGFTGSFPLGTQWSLRQPVYGLCQAPREWYDTLRTTLAALGFSSSTADPSLFLRTDTHCRHSTSSCTARRTITLTQSHMVQQVLQHFGFTWSSAQATPLAIGHSLSALPSDDSVEPSGPYPELVGCLITSGMGLVLGGRPSVVLTGHSDASWVDDQDTQRSSQGYTFSLGSCSVSWRSTRSSSVLSSSCEAEIYATAMAAQELRWLTYLLTDLGKRPSSPPVLYVDNKAAIALCQEHRLEHRTKHIALRYFLARELQQRGQLCLRYVATRANTADIFTKALQLGDHQRFCTVLGLVPTVPHLL
ncbi:unnamed protein product [Closterium sp. NIES-53]